MKKMVFTPDAVKVIKDMMDFWYNEVPDWDEEDLIVFLLDVAHDLHLSRDIEIEYSK